MTYHRNAWAGAAAALIGWGSPAFAQYSMDSAPALAPGQIRYFGAAKDERGRVLRDVTFSLQSGPITFVYVTDHDGRFRGALPTEVPVARIQARCMKAGYQVIRVSKRPGVASGRRFVQLDCLLRRVAG